MTHVRLDGIGYGHVYWFPGHFFAGLSGFGLRYEDDDHKVMSLSIGGTTAEHAMPRHNYTMGMHDNSAIDNHEDVARSWTKYIHLGDLTEEYARGVTEGRGTVSIPIPPIGPEDSFVLRGLTITQTRSHDHNIRKIGVRLNPSGRAIDVTFEDNSPGDDGFEAKVVFGRVISSRASYNTRIQYAGPFSVESTFTVNSKLVKENDRPSLLTGFLFEFLDTDHFIREIKIDPVDDESYDVVFTDDEEDNPAKVIIDYISIYDADRER